MRTACRAHRASFKHAKNVWFSKLCVVKIHWSSFSSRGYSKIALTWGHPRLAVPLGTSGTQVSTGPLLLGGCNLRTIFCMFLLQTHLHGTLLQFCVCFVIKSLFPQRRMILYQIKDCILYNQFYAI